MVDPRRTLQEISDPARLAELALVASLRAGAHLADAVVRGWVVPVVSGAAQRIAPLGETIG